MQIRNSLNHIRHYAPEQNVRNISAIIYVPPERVLREAMTIFNMAVAYAGISPRISRTDKKKSRSGASGAGPRFFGDLGLTGSDQPGWFRIVTCAQSWMR